MATTLPAVKKFNELKVLIESPKVQTAIKEALPKHISPETMLRIAMTTIRSKGRLLQCTSLSLISAIVEASQLGLVLDNILGQAYLVPFKQVAIMMIGYRGFGELFRNSGKGISLRGFPAYEGDIDSQGYLKADIEKQAGRLYVGSKPGDDRGKFVGAYAVARFVGGHVEYDFMWKEDIDKVRSVSRAKDDGPWVDWYEPMAAKTVVRRLAKSLPLSAEREHERFDHIAARAAVLDEGRELGYVSPDAGISNVFGEEYIAEEAPEITEDMEAEDMIAAAQKRAKARSDAESTVGPIEVEGAASAPEEETAAPEATEPTIDVPEGLRSIGDFMDNVKGLKSDKLQAFEEANRGFLMSGNCHPAVFARFASKWKDVMKADYGDDFIDEEDEFPFHEDSTQVEEPEPPEATETIDDEKKRAFFLERCQDYKDVLGGEIFDRVVQAFQVKSFFHVNPEDYEDFLTMCEEEVAKQ